MQHRQCVISLEAVCPNCGRNIQQQILPSSFEMAYGGGHESAAWFVIICSYCHHDFEIDLDEEDNP